MCSTCWTCGESSITSGMLTTTGRGLAVAGPTLTLISLMPNCHWTFLSQLQMLLLAHTFPGTCVYSTFCERHIMCCIVIVRLNSSWRQHTPVFSSPLRGTGHDPSHLVPLPLPTASCPPLAPPICQNTSLAVNLSDEDSHRLGSCWRKEIGSVCCLPLHPSF